MPHKENLHPLPDRHPSDNRARCITTSIESRGAALERKNYFEAADLFCQNLAVVVLQNAPTDHAVNNAHWESNFSIRSFPCTNLPRHGHRACMQRRLRPQ